MSPRTQSRLFIDHGLCVRRVVDSALSMAHAAVVQRIQASRHFRVSAERASGFITDMRNWSTFFPGFVALDPESRWTAVGDVASLTTELFGRKRHMQLTLDRIEPNRAFSYTSRQEGLPDAHHERTFSADSGGFTFHLSVTYEPRPGLPGIADRILLRSAVRRLLYRTLDALDVSFAS